MAAYSYKYIIIGGGVAGTSAIRGIREIDKKGSILLVSNEAYLPYQRPALSKNLWLSTKTINDIFIQKQSYFDSQQCALELGMHITSIHPDEREIIDEQNRHFSYESLLLATGAFPRRLTIPGGELDDVFYFRKYEDFLRLSNRLKPGRSIMVIGGGFIGTEIAATFAQKGMRVSMLFPESWLCFQLFPDALGRNLLQKYTDHGIDIINDDRPAHIAQANGTLITQTQKGKEIKSDYAVVGIGSIPAVELAQTAKLTIAGGILVNSYLQTSNPAIYAAGDAATFCDQNQNCNRRVEHWQNAMKQGRLAGRNMAGEKEPYVHQSFFFSEIFDFSYKVIGDAGSSQETVSDWQTEYKQGVVYYLKEDKITGIMLCNCPEKVEPARALLQRNDTVAVGSLKGAL